MNTLYKKNTLARTISAEILGGFVALPALAQEIEEIQVVGVRQRLEQAGVLKDTIERTELVGSDKLETATQIFTSSALPSP